MLWTIAAGFVFSMLNATARAMSKEIDPFETQFLRYLAGAIVMAPLVLRSGLRRYRPSGVFGQFWRGFVHTIGLMLWFAALPKITLADMTAIGFTGPIFIMIGAAIFLGEKMVLARWIAAAVGFAGVVIVVGPKLTGAGGYYTLVMLASSPVFAASFLITKTLTRRDSAEVIVLWQAISVTLFSLPLALVHWTWPTATQLAWFLLCGFLGNLGHYCLTRSFHVTDISATQSVKFVDLIWASLLGYLVFADVPSRSTIVGGLVIFSSTLWIAHREARRRRAPAH
jgi:drug/metabolite transporter (DMT)-like permease